MNKKRSEEGDGIIWYLKKKKEAKKWKGKW